MRPTAFADFHLHYEAPEAGRYLAPILVLPGLFQSFACWRATTSMLAHRGWEVYALTRSMPDGDGRTRLLDRSWQALRERVRAVAQRLEDPLVVLGADLGGALALDLASQRAVLALALLAPAPPARLGAACAASQSFASRLGLASPRASAVAAKLRPALAEHAQEEPDELLAELASVSWQAPRSHPPAIVFAADGDPLVSPEDSTPFVAEPHARLSRLRLAGRFWPATQTSVADEIHRFLILTLGDRVVEFPEGVLEDDA